MKQLSRRLVVFVTTIILSLAQANVNAHERPPATMGSSTITISVHSSLRATSYSILEIQGLQISKEIGRARTIIGQEDACWDDMDVELRQDGQKSHYLLAYSGQLWDKDAHEMLNLPRETSDKLLKYAETLRARHYGNLVGWEEAERTIARKNVFTITDLETGLSFRVQRRAGSDHADVQPLTKEDTAVMKRIYDGRWSWKRKPIVVTYGSHRLAASMNGMPHGGDGIPENGFSGHFCVHFQGSTSHKSKYPDSAHQLMIYKAAGNVRPYLDSIPPRVLAESFVEAIYQRDTLMLRRIWTTIPQDKLAYFEREMANLVSIRIRSTSRKQENTDPMAEVQGLTAEVRLPIAVHQQGHSDRNTEYRIECRRDSEQSPWRVVNVATDYSSLMP